MKHKSTNTFTAITYGDSLLRNKHKVAKLKRKTSLEHL